MKCCWDLEVSRNLSRSLLCWWPTLVWAPGLQMTDLHVAFPVLPGWLAFCLTIIPSSGAIAKKNEVYILLISYTIFPKKKRNDGLNQGHSPGKSKTCGRVYRTWGSQPLGGSVVPLGTFWSHRTFLGSIFPLQLSRLFRAEFWWSLHLAFLIFFLTLPMFCF